MNPASVEKLFKRYFKPVRSWLNRRCGVQTAELDDLAMEVFLRLLRYDSKDLVDNPAGYVFKISSNVASEWRDRCRVKYQHDDSWLEDLIDDNDEYSFDQDELQEYVQSLMSELSPRKQQILYMHVYDGLTYNQIAAKLGITYRIVLRELTNTYSALRFKVDKDGVLR